MYRPNRAPKPKDPVLKEAKQYYRRLVRRWRKEKDTLLESIAAIEDTNLRECVSFIAESIVRGHGALVFKVQSNEHREIGCSTVDLDEDIADMLAETYGEEVPDKAGHWLLHSLNGRTLGFVAWTFKHLQSNDGEVLVGDRVCYGLEEQRILGVYQRDGAGLVPMSLL
jgi:hypothetical protein